MRGRSARTDCVSYTDEAASLRPITMCRARPSGAVAAGRWPLSQQALLLPRLLPRRHRLRGALDNKHSKHSKHNKHSRPPSARSTTHSQPARAATRTSGRPRGRRRAWRP